MARTRTTHTYALLSIPPEAYRLVRERLAQAAGGDEDSYLGEEEGQEIMNFGTVALIADKPQT